MDRRPLILIVLLFSMLSLFGQHRHLSEPSWNFTFTENRSQWPSHICYRSELPGGVLFLENQEFTYLFYDQASYRRLMRFKFNPGEASPAPDMHIPCHAFKVKLQGARGLNPLPDGKLPSVKHYFYGRKTFRSEGIRDYTRLSYPEVYPGIKLEMDGTDHQLKYTYVVHAGADPGQIRMQYTGADLKIRKGNLQIKTSVTTLLESAPIAWQILPDGSKKSVRCAFDLEDNVVGFRFPDGYDAAYPLIIDPTLIFSSYSGSPVDNWGYTATYDKKGYLYAGGVVFQFGYPHTTGAFQQTFGGGNSDIVISKYDTTGSYMVYSTYLGGSGAEVPTSLVVNNTNDLFILGSTGSADFPVTPNAFDTSFNGGTNYTLTSLHHYTNGSDIIIVRLSEDGSTLQASTYLGGSGNDGLNQSAPLKHNYADDPRGEINVDEAGNVFVSSSTWSADLPVSPGAFQSSPGGLQDACIFRMKGDLSQLDWCSYYGGSGLEAGYGINFDESGNVYFVGGTTSQNLPVTASALYQGFQGGLCDGFIARCNPAGSVLLSSGYYGSPLYDQVYFIDRNKSGAIFVFGQTNAQGQYFISNTNYNTPGGGQFISKLSPDLQTRIWSTAFGSGNGGPDISPTAFLVDLCDHIYISGWGSYGMNSFGGTNGLPVTADAFQTTTDSADYYFAVFNTDVSGLLYASFFGGTSHEHVDGGTSRFDKKGRIYQSVCAGCGGKDDFPTTPNALSQINGSMNCNNGVIKFDFAIPLSVADFIQPPTACAPYTVVFQNTSGSPAGSNPLYLWDFGDGGTSMLKNPTHTFLQTGTYSVRLIVSDTGSCNTADTMIRNVVVIADTNYNLPSLPLCNSQQQVQIGISPPPDPAIQYSWSPATALSNPNIPNPWANPSVTTQYTLIMSIANCADTIHQTVNVQNLNVEAGNDTLVCSTTLQLTASANADSLRFHWSSFPDFSDTLNPGLTDSSVWVNLPNQFNWFYVMAFNDICQTIDSVLVSYTFIVSPGAGEAPTCPDSCDGSASVSVNGAVLPVEYLWNNGAITPSIHGLCAGSYTVTVTDAANCKSVATILLEDPAPLTIAMTVEPVPCVDNCEGSIQCTISGGTAPYTYTWSHGAGTLNLENLCMGTYTLSVSDAHQCPALKTATVEVENIFMDVEITQSEDTIYSGQTVHLQVNGQQGWNYQWSPAGSLSSNLVPDPAASPQVSTTYFLTITDPSGCVFTDSVRIAVRESTCEFPYVFVPNAFTPNGDHKNDLLLVYGDHIVEMKLQIFDRWGELVFESSDPKKGWDGRHNGNPCEPSVYVYHLEVQCIDGMNANQKGNITLIR